jgi:CDP-diacylglycerol--glycerol-3-phosphate 3-phosphatidyltransferase
MNVIPQAVKDGFVRLTGPVVQALIRGGVKPNTISTVGALVVVGSAVAYGTGAIRLGGALLLASGLFDILDGQVARLGGLSTTFGAFYDSSLDRVGEAALFGGIALHFMRGGLLPGEVVWGVMLAIAALSASLLVSYTRARAEGLGLDCRVGIAARAERIVVLGAPTLLFGAGRDGRLLLWIVAVLALATTITVIQRIVHVARLVDPALREPAARRRDTQPGRASLRERT